jgi:hypothetical protein
MSDSFDAFDNEGLPELDQKFKFKFKIDSSTYNFGRGHLEFVGDGQTDRSIYLTRDLQGASFFRRCLNVFMHEDKTYYLDKHLTYSYFQEKHNETWLSVKAKVFNFITPSKAAAINRGGEYVGPIREAYDAQRRSESQLKAVGGSYELIVGQLVRDYEQSVRTIVEQELVPLSHDVDTLYKFAFMYGNNEEFALAQLDMRVAQLQADFAAIKKSMETHLLPLLLRIHSAARNAYHMRDKRERAKQSLGKGDSFDDSYLSEIFVQSATDDFCFFPGEAMRHVQIYDPAAKRIHRETERIRLEMLTGGLAQSLMHDVRLAKEKFRMEIREKRVLTIPEFLNLARRERLL